MAGAHFVIDFSSLEQAVAALQRLANGGDQLMLADMGEYLLGAHQRRFDAEVSPDGTPWAPLSPRYKRRKDRERPGAKKLVYDNFLKGTLRYQVKAGELLFGSNREYAAIHQFGGDINIPARSTLAYFSQSAIGRGDSRFVKRRRSDFAQWVTIPAYTVTMTARPWLGLAPDDKAELARIVADHVGGALQGQKPPPA